MKNRQWLGILIPLVAAVFILSLFSGIAAADTPKETYEKANEQYKAFKEKYSIAKDRHQEAKARYDAARLKFKSAKNNISREELVNSTRIYLERVIDEMIAHLEVLKSRVESSEKGKNLPNAVDNINKHIAQLEDIRTKVEQATTAQELVDSHRELKDLWVKMKLEYRYYAGILVNQKIDAFLGKADTVSASMDTTIQNLNGKEVTRLEEAASSFDNLVSEAKANHQKTLDRYASHSGFDSNGLVTNNKDAEAFLREATDLQKETIKKLKSASKQLRDFFREAKKMKVVVRGSGTGTLTNSQEV